MALIEAYCTGSFGDIKCALSLNPTPSSGGGGGGGDLNAQARAAFDAQVAALPSSRRPAWNGLDLSRDDALARIAGAGPGAFVLRPSDKAFCALSLVKKDGSQWHQHIDALPAGLQIKKTSAVHADLFALVDYYSDPAQRDLPGALRP